MEEKVRAAILKTLIYSDVFDYPLKKEEIWKYLISASIDRALFEKDLISLAHLRWERKHGYYFLYGREEIVGKRIKRKKESQKKLALARKIIQKLSLFPTVLFIGISGGLALENSDEKDDMDLFIIISATTLWITRLFLVLSLKLMGQYRGRGKKQSEKVCLNMLIDEDNLSFKKDRQNLYTAHEVVQLKPIFDRNNFYEKFKSSNQWIIKYLPNTMIKDISDKHQSKSFFSLFEKLAKTLQLRHMKKYITSETVSDKMLAFHPFEYKEHVLKEYNKRLKQYEI